MTNPAIYGKIFRSVFKRTKINTKKLRTRPMKKLMVAAMTAAAFAAFADEPAPQDAAPQETPANEAEVEEDGAPLIWGFGSTGIYSGYQLYGSLLNSEPTWQTYAEGNLNLPWDIGSVGVGVWFNSDLTKQ